MFLSPEEKLVQAARQKTRHSHVAGFLFVRQTRLAPYFGFLISRISTCQVNHSFQ